MNASHRLAMRLLMVGFDGLELPGHVGRWIDDGLGGVILFRRNIESLEQLVALNGEILGRNQPLMLGVDEEGGRVRRLRGITSDLPAMAQIGATNDPKLAYRCGALLGRELAALGFSINFAPILDVHTNPNNPVIGDRAFATTPEAVARMALPFAKGLQDMGVAACGKHFPGHGDTDTDSHLALPVLDHNEHRLASIELAPFRQAAQTEMASMMTAHVVIKAYNEEHPSTLDGRALAILRRQYRFPGVIISDDLEMAAIADRYSMAEAIERGLHAGVDLFLVCRAKERVEQSIEAVCRLAERPKTATLVAAAARRVETMVQRYVGRPGRPSLGDAKRILKALPLPGELNLAETGDDPTETADRV
jgi:beta-N-acetylhexosaminidase